MQGAQVPSLVEELRSHMPSGAAKNFFFFLIILGSQLGERPVEKDHWVKGSVRSGFKLMG